MLKFRFSRLTQKNRPVDPKKRKERHCNICNREFLATSRFHRFCDACRNEDELFKFFEYLPLSPVGS